ncbi:MAG: bifunctional 5,10-methylenetetrahydrofolate dehydrogenase/5,10-methenyltetrahydrofolate cyclohydrolase [Coriobacteriales bacterium]|jgi:methylenetetrahydrofolate dehydrogenase (NADP+)/methenyltetrahydrofolate cyclohydrolase|nr:bifunctional 5,10-methylenetetrahydrofolate dehydrogenase/5,10-methenyltetrahydrofolate cyclohydrolase [Coriobacteriales bacterium]
MTRILKGPAVAQAINTRSTAAALALKKRGIEPQIAIVRAGERGDALSYERGATRRAEEVGIAVRPIVLDETASQAELIATVESLNADASLHGVLLLRPFPLHIDDGAVRNALAVAKDIDGITDASVIGVFTGRGRGFAPCTAQACMEILDYYGIDCAGKNAVVVGRSLVVGKPAAMMLLERNATVTIAHSRSTDLPALVRRAELVITCVGQPRMFDEHYFLPGQTVIDVGINVTADGSLVGDVDFEAVEGIVEALSPVPGGVGSVTTGVLLKHVIEAAERAMRPVP